MSDSTTTPPSHWTEVLDDQQRREIAFARIYASEPFRHRTPGASQYLLIALLADMLDQALTGASFVAIQPAGQE